MKTVKMVFRAILNSSIDEVMETDSSDDKGCTRLINLEESGILKAVCEGLGEITVLCWLAHWPRPILITTVNHYLP